MKEILIFTAVIWIGGFLEGFIHGGYRAVTGRALYLDVSWRKAKRRFLREIRNG